MPAATSALPTLRADRRGYVLAGESVDGFHDRTDVSPEARLRLAEWARRFAPDTLDDEQQQLLEGERRPPVRPSDELLAALLDAERDVSATYALGFYDDLSEQELEVARDPSLSLEGVAYPLTMDQMQKVTGASKRQLRYWDTLGLIPSHRINGRRRFGSAAVARALALKNCQQHEVAALAVIARGGPDAARFARLLAAQIGTLADRVTGVAGREIAGAAALIVERSQDLASTVIEKAPVRAEDQTRSAPRAASRPKARSGAAKRAATASKAPPAAAGSRRASTATKRATRAKGQRASRSSSSSSSTKP